MAGSHWHWVQFMYDAAAAQTRAAVDSRVFESRRQARESVLELLEAMAAYASGDARVSTLVTRWRRSTSLEVLDYGTAERLVVFACEGSCKASAQRTVRAYNQAFTRRTGAIVHTVLPPEWTATGTGQ